MGGVDGPVLMSSLTRAFTATITASALSAEAWPLFFKILLIGLAVWISILLWQLRLYFEIVIRDSCRVLVRLQISVGPNQVYRIISLVNDELLMNIKRLLFLLQRTTIFLEVAVVVDEEVLIVDRWTVGLIVESASPTVR